MYTSTILRNITEYNTILYIYIYIYIYIVYSLMFVLVRSVSLGGPISEVDLSKSVSTRPNANS